MAQKQARLREVLRQSGLMGARELAEALGVSQPTVSRCVRALSLEILRTHARGRGVRYACLRPIPVLENAAHWPLFQVDGQGALQTAGVLHAVYGAGGDVAFYVAGGAFEGMYPSLPWFLYDNRPKGFLGRAVARRMSEWGFSQNPEGWSDTNILEYMTRFGADLPGAFVVGDAAADAARALRYESVAQDARERRYPELAANAMAGGTPHSSAAGEQPKFTTLVCASQDVCRHVLVKFSGVADTPVARRWADLLVAEYWAAEVLRERGFSVPHTELIFAGGRVFLECARIDRVGRYGRKNYATVGALPCAEDKQDSGWVAIARAGVQSGFICEDDFRKVERLHEFGRRIGNGDMHAGNLSFFTTNARAVRLAPVYDMLPMCYAPQTDGALPEAPLTPLRGGGDVADAARDYWARLSGDARVSDGFRAIARANAAMSD